MNFFGNRAFADNRVKKASLGWALIPATGDLARGRYRQTQGGAMRTRGTRAQGPPEETRREGSLWHLPRHPHLLGPARTRPGCSGPSHLGCETLITLGLVA